MLCVFDPPKRTNHASYHLCSRVRNSISLLLTKGLLKRNLLVFVMLTSQTKSKRSHTSLKPGWREHPFLHILLPWQRILLPILVFHPSVLGHLFFHGLDELPLFATDGDDASFHHVLFPEFEKLCQAFGLLFGEVVNFASVKPEVVELPVVVAYGASFSQQTLKRNTSNAMA
jgi:hypothetical protein